MKKQTFSAVFTASMLAAGLATSMGAHATDNEWNTSMGETSSVGTSMTRAEVLADLKEARSMGLLDTVGEAGPTEAVWKAREQHAQRVGAEIVARYEAQEQAERERQLAFAREAERRAAEAEVQRMASPQTEASQAPVAMTEPSRVDSMTAQPAPVANEAPIDTTTSAEPTPTTPTTPLNEPAPAADVAPPPSNEPRTPLN